MIFEVSVLLCIFFIGYVVGVKATKNKFKELFKRGVKRG